MSLRFVVPRGDLSPKTRLLQLHDLLELHWCFGVGIANEQPLLLSEQLLLLLVDVLLVDLLRDLLGELNQRDLVGEQFLGYTLLVLLVVPNARVDQLLQQFGECYHSQLLALHSNQVFPVYGSIYDALVINDARFLFLLDLSAEGGKPIHDALLCCVEVLRLGHLLEGLEDFLELLHGDVVALLLQHQLPFEEVPGVLQVGGLDSVRG